MDGSPDFRTIFVDESSQNNHPQLVLGGLICRASACASMATALAHIRRPELPAGELKWTKVSTAKLAAYVRVVDFFFDCDRVFGPVHFHALTVEMAKRNEGAFNGGSREIGFNKEIYQLLMKFGRLYPGALFHVYPDERQTASSTEELRLILNRGTAKRGDTRDWPYRRLHFRNSNSEPLLQVADILIGALAFHLNGHRLLPAASAAKCELSDYILDRAGIRTPWKDTAISGKFTLWHRRLKGVPQS